MGIIATGLVVLLAGAGGGFFYLGHKSQNMEMRSTLNHNLLNPCAEKPNCVTTFPTKDTSHSIKPMEVKEFTFKKLVIPQNCKLVKEQQNYQYYLCKSSIFGFTDDLEFLYDANDNKLHARSESRVGHSDMGANRERVQAIFNSLQSR